MVTGGEWIPLGRQSLLPLTCRAPEALYFPFLTHSVVRLKMNSEEAETDTVEDS